VDTGFRKRSCVNNKRRDAAATAVILGRDALGIFPDAAPERLPESSV
jgi:hypothetical protein